MKRNVIVSIVLVVAAFLFAHCFSAAALANEAIWIEGEDYSASTFVETQGAGSWYHSDKIRKDLLSPGEPGVSNNN